jgi:hypothetical protein
VGSGLSWSGLLVRTPRRLGRCARPRRCCGPRTVFRTPRSLVGARPRRSLSIGGVAGSPRRDPLRWGDAVALLNLLAAFTGGTQGQALSTVPGDARQVPKLSTGGSYRHSRLARLSCAGPPGPVTVRLAGRTADPCRSTSETRDSRRSMWMRSKAPRWRLRIH